MFESFIENESPNVVMGTESWLDSTIASAEIFPHHLQVFRKDRNLQGGGVFVAVSNNIPCFERPDLSMNDTELIWCQASLSGQAIYFGSFYRPPDSKVHPLDHLSESLAKINAESKSPFIVLGGDFNVPGIKWSHDMQATPKGALQEALIDVARNNYLTQQVTFSTRHDDNGTENILDLLLTSHPSLVNNINPCPGISDHTIVTANITTKTKLANKPPRNIPLWSKVKEEDLKEKVQHMATKFFSRKPEETTVENNWTWFRDNLRNIVNEVVPHKKIKGYSRPPWFSSKIKKLCSIKEKAYNKAKARNDKAHWDKFTKTRKQVDRFIRNAHRQYVYNLLESDHPKDFWRYIRSRRKDNTGIQTLKRNGALITEDLDKAEALSNQFQSVFTREDTASFVLPKLPPSPYPDMPPIQITSEGVRKLLTNINVAKAIGPDLIPNQVLKIAAEEIAPILTIIFQQSLDTGSLPLDWRKANITPIFKKGSTTDPANYRPVSLTCTCCKLLEHIIDSNLMRHLSAFNILADNQHAFRKRRSCESQLILTMNDLSKNIDGKKTTDMAVLDFSKAFDVIPHSKLLMKLDYYGIRANTKDWIASFLTKRYQRVCVNGQSSDWKPVLSGTPQGTVLGPHLFLLHINDIHHQVSSTTRLFADDCLVYREINSAEDEAALQSDLNTMVNWSKTWGMHFNPTKCKAMRVSRKRTPGKTNYNILGVDLEETVETQYLGIFIHKDIRWNKQTQHASAKATRTLNFVKRNFHHCSPSVKEKLYKTLIRPHLEYASAAWDPFTAKNILALESVQRRAARFVTNTYGRDTSVTQILNNLKWTPLEDRREAHRLTCLYKILHGQLDIGNDNEIRYKPTRERRGHANQLIVNAASTDAYRYSFFPRSIRSWNGLAPSTISQDDPIKFKQALSTDPLFSSRY